MVTIIHGDDIVSSRNYLQDQRRKLVNAISFDGQFDLQDFIQAAQGSDLFSSNKDIIIENFFSKNKINSTLTKNILDYINKNSSSFDLILWEGKEIQKKYLSLLKNQNAKIFMIPKTIFLFLDSILPGNYNISVNLFHKALASTEPELIFFMIQRQFRILLAVTDKKTDKAIDEVSRLAPWQRGKLERQSRFFSPNKLLDIYKRLYKIETMNKTGGFPHSLDKAIDFFLLSI